MNLEIENGVLKKLDMLYFGDIDVNEIVIPHGVTKIGYRAFENYGCRIERLTIPDTVTEIGESTFDYCPALTDLTIGKGVKVFGEYVFGECDNLKTVTLPDRDFKLDRKLFSEFSNFTINYKEN